MSPQSSNTAKQISESEALGIEEPSMDEILASIKKIISDDEVAEANLFCHLRRAARGLSDRAVMVN